MHHKNASSKHKRSTSEHLTLLFTARPRTQIKHFCRKMTRFNLYNGSQVKKIIVGQLRGMTNKNKHRIRNNPFGPTPR